MRDSKFLGETLLPPRGSCHLLFPTALWEGPPLGSDSSQGGPPPWFRQLSWRGHPLFPTALWEGPPIGSDNSLGGATPWCRQLSGWAAPWFRQLSGWAGGRAKKHINVRNVLTQFRFFAKKEPGIWHLVYVFGSCKKTISGRLPIAGYDSQSDP